VGGGQFEHNGSHQPDLQLEGCAVVRLRRGDMIDFNNLEEYTDPDTYDLENKGFEPNGPFFLALAQRSGGPVLELGCGTGRITIPLAQQGINITGLDAAAEMLERARAKAQDLPIRWIEADARTFHLERQYNLIFEARTFEHFLTRADQEAVLARVHEHLAPEGLFALSVGFTRPELMGSTGMHDWFSYKNETGQEMRVSGTYEYDPVSQISIETAHRSWRDAEGRERVKRTPLALRHFFPQEMEALLHYNGFVVMERYGNWDSSPLTPGSEVMIYVCRKAG
jgi:SAM-dependent methyltransferase